MVTAAGSTHCLMVGEDYAMSLNRVGSGIIKSYWARMGLLSKFCQFNICRIIIYVNVLPDAPPFQGPRKRFNLSTKDVVEGVFRCVWSFALIIITSSLYFSVSASTPRYKDLL